MLINVILLFLKLGTFSIGGGYALMSLMLSEGERIVGLTTGEFADMAALELLASGPIAINAATYVGYIRSGIPGSILATLAVIAPSFVFCSAIYYFLKRFSESKLLNSFMDAIKTATGGLMLSTAFVLGQDIFFPGEASALSVDTVLGSLDLASVIIAAICLFALAKFKLNPIWVILGSAVLGIIFL